MRNFLIKCMLVSAIVPLALFVACSDDADDAEPKVVSVTGVTVDQETLNFAVGSEVDTLVATVLPANATNKTVTWKSDDSDIASVDQNGAVTPGIPGTTTIIVTTVDGGMTDTCVVTITEGVISVTEVTVGEEELNLFVGDEGVVLEATVLPAEATNQKITWKSDDYDVAIVNQDGVVTAEGNGTTTITVTTEDGEKTATCIVNVKTKVSSVVVQDKLNLALTEEEPVALVATVLPEEASNKNFTWKSGDITVATVDDEGVVTARKDGVTEIIVTTEDGKMTDTCVVTVVAEIIPIEMLSCAPMMLMLTEGAETGTIVAMIFPNNATFKPLIWESSNELIATVDKFGVVTPVGMGSCNVIVSVGQVSDSAMVMVMPAPILVTEIRFPPFEFSLDFFEGGQGRIIATPGDAYKLLLILPKDAANQGITWSSGDKAIATVDAVSGFITPLTVGKTRMTVTATDGSGISAFKEINVKAKQDQGHDDFENVDGVL